MAYPRIANDRFELLADPATGRIFRYGSIGGPNVLWQNLRACECRSPFPGWLNWGGDKVWLWPENDWAAGGGPKVPPGDPPAAPYEITVEGLRMRMVSPVIASHGVRIVRQITLKASGSNVTLENKIECIAPSGGTRPLAVWTVTQLPAPRQLFGRLLVDAPTPAFEGFRESPWRDAHADGNIVTMGRPASPWMKIGLEADLLAAPVGEQLLVARVTAHSPGTFEPHRRAQVFSDPDDSPFRLPGIPPYIELEFTSPLKVLAVGESVSLTLEWQLLDIAGASSERIGEMVRGAK
jgi:hypothetical protein